MNRDKAREFFSSYAEGTLEQGLRGSLESRLGSDHELQREFISFRQTVDELENLQYLKAPVPADLHEKIAARLDRHIWEQKQAAKPAWTGWLRNMAIAGVGALAIVGAAFSIFHHGGSAATASLIGFAPNQIEAEPVGNSVRVRYLATGKQTISVDSAGKGLKSDKLNSDDRWETILTNPNPTAVLFRVAVVGDEHPLEIAVPGESGVHSKTGQGSVEDLAKAIADTYKVPVILAGRDFNESVTWKFDQTEIFKAAGTSLEGRNYSVEVKSGNALWITKNE